MTSPMKAATVCVTGASGFIASHIVAQLLEKGYAVHGTVRDLGDEKKTKHLLNLAQQKEAAVNSGYGGNTQVEKSDCSSCYLPSATLDAGNLRLFSADLMGGPGSFDAAVEGCAAVFHTATPLIKEAEDGDKEILQPGLRGLKEVLTSVEKFSDTVKVFVLTSSMSAVAPVPEPDVKTEAHWSDPSAQRARNNWYGATKTLQEKYLWQWLAERKASCETVPRCVAICPTAVLGPMLQPTVNRTNGWILNLLKEGKAGGQAPNDSMSFIHVRDCVAQHIAAMENETAEGRFMSVAGTRVAPPPPPPNVNEEDGPSQDVWQAMHWNEIFPILKKIYPEMPDVTPCEGDPVRETRFDFTKTNTLVHIDTMLQPEEIFQDLADHLRSRGLL